MLHNRYSVGEKLQEDSQRLLGASSVSVQSQKSLRAIFAKCGPTVRVRAQGEKDRENRLKGEMGSDQLNEGGERSAPGFAVRLQGVRVSYRFEEGSYDAIEYVDLDLRDGEFLSIVGPTGCGKTTLLNVAAGLIAPSQGRVEIFGSILSGLNDRAGYLFQADALFPWKTVLENVAIGLEVAHVPRQEARTRAREWLKRVGLSAFIDRYPHMLSGGQKKRVALAQVLIRDPKILLMDEPFGPLDAQTRQIMGNLLLDLWHADKKAVVFVTHDLEEAIALSDRVVVMAAGPNSRIIGDWKIFLPRPRDIAEIKLEPAFHKVHREIWMRLKEEVVKTYAQAEGLPS
jgi:NitT/TauT family transport system ATP-binding protein